MCLDTFNFKKCSFLVDSVHLPGSSKSIIQRPSILEPVHHISALRSSSMIPVLSTRAVAGPTIAVKRQRKACQISPPDGEVYLKFNIQGTVHPMHWLHSHRWQRGLGSLRRTCPNSCAFQTPTFELTIGSPVAFTQRVRRNSNLPLPILLRRLCSVLPISQPLWDLASDFPP